MCQNWQTMTSRRASLMKARQQREVVVLNEDNRRTIADLLEHGLRKSAIDLAVGLPVAFVELRARVGDVTERPDRAVGQPVVVAVFLFLAQPDAAKRVGRAIGRDSDTALGVGHFAIGRAAAMRHPCAAPRAHHGVEGRHQPAGGANPRDLFLSIVGDGPTAAPRTRADARASAARWMYGSRLATTTSCVFLRLSPSAATSSADVMSLSLSFAGQPRQQRVDVCRYCRAGSVAALSRDPTSTLIAPFDRAERILVRHVVADEHDPADSPAPLLDVARNPAWWHRPCDRRRWAETRGPDCPVEPTQATADDPLGGAVVGECQRLLATARPRRREHAPRTVACLSSRRGPAPDPARPRVAH